MSSYRLCDGKSLVVEDASITWNNGVRTQASMNVSIVQSSPSDSINDTFSTAIEDLSALETTKDISFEDVPNVSVTNTKNTDNLELSKEGEGETSNLTDNGEQQVVIFKLEGSDDLYGIQLAQDEEGNIQKYQYQFRTTDDGQLEAIPDTIQLLPNDSDDNQESFEDATEVVDTQEGQIHEQNSEIQETQVFVTEESSSDSIDSNVHFKKGKSALVEQSDDNQVDSLVNKLNEMNENTLLVLIKNESEVEKGGGDIDDSEWEDNYSEDEAIDVKPDFIELQGTNTEVLAVNVKQEGHMKSIQNEKENNEEIDEFACGETQIHEETVIADSIGCHSEAGTYDTDTQDEETVIEYQHFETQSIDKVCEETSQCDNQSDQHQDLQEEHYSNIFIENGQIEEITSNTQLDQHIIEDVHYLQKEIPDESDNENYEMVEGLPVTAEGDSSEDSTLIYEQESVFNEAIIEQLPLRKHNASMTTNILKQQMDSNNAKDSQKKTILYYTVHTTDQKENVNSLPLAGETIVPPKPNPRSLLKNNVDVKLQDDNQLILEKRDKMLEKRYARSKEAVQAKLFNNFINKTTIPHAPVRQIRLPRKQEIKPVDTRRNEEIIVQEVMVSSKGFIENTNERLKSKDKLEVTSIVELSDSDEEYNPNNSSKKKKKHKKLIKVFAATSEDSDTSVIEILPSDEELDKQHKDKLPKKSPGRPKKSIGDVLKRPRGRPPKHDGSSPQKKSKTESSEMESDCGKKEFKCPHCSKSFPSQSSLNTHIQHHNLENNLRSSTRFSVMEYKHVCDQCGEKFKNSILLKRHVCQKKDTKSKCNICSKCFSDVSLFNIHKKTHVKQNLVKTTTSVTISPKKFLPRPSTSGLQKPSVIYKCERCCKICPTQALLTKHEKCHINFACPNCKAKFASKILCDNHVRVTCVKQQCPKNRRLSFKIRKSFVQSPRTVSEKRKSVNPGLNSESMSRCLDVKVTCDSCAKHFSTLTALYKHKVKFSGMASRKRKRDDPGIDLSVNRAMDVGVECEICAQKFSTLTALLKHKVKDHGLETPDKRVLLPKKKTIHKPLNAHGGIPASSRLNKAFQGLREKFANRSENATIFEGKPENK